MEGTFLSFLFWMHRHATIKPPIGLNAKGQIVVFVLLNSNQPIDRPSKEPHLGLSFVGIFFGFFLDI